MFRAVGLWRTVLHRSVADRSILVAAWLLLVCATTLLVAGVVYGDTVGLGGLRHAVLAAPPEDRAIVVRTGAAPADVADVASRAAAEVSRTLEATGGEVALVARSDPFAPAGTPTDDVAHLTSLVSYQDLGDHATLIAGAWPSAGQDPLEASLSEQAAAALGLSVGDAAALTSRLDPGLTVRVRVSGLWRPDPSDPYWLANGLELKGVDSQGRFITRGPFAVGLGDLLARAAGRNVALEWRAIPSVEGLRVDGLDPLRTALSTLDGRLRDALPGRDVSVTTPLPPILAAAAQAIVVARGGVTLLTIQFGVLAGYAVLLLAGMLLERRRAEVALLRSRGASSGHLIAVAVGEALLLAVPAALVAPWLAAGVVRVLGTVGPLPTSGIVGEPVIGPDALVVAAIAGAACAAAMLIPTISSSTSLAGARTAVGRQVGRTLGQRLGVDLALLVVAAIGLWQLRLYGAPLTRNVHGALGLDPLLVAAPALGLLAGSVVATRLVPRLAEVAERVLERRRSLVPPLSARQLARRPLRYTRSALLLMLAAALGTFAAAYGATWERSQADQAAHQAGADQRVIIADHPDLPAWALGAAYRGIPGVRSATAVLRQPLDVGRAVRAGQLLGIDPAALPSLVTARSGEADSLPVAALEQLAAARPTTAALALPAGTRSLTVTIDADLHAPTASTGTDPAADGRIGLAALILDADGLHRVAGGEATFRGRGQRIAIALAGDAGGRSYPLGDGPRLEALELTLLVPQTLSAVGTADVVAVTASTAASGQGGASATPVALDPAAPGWEWGRLVADRTLPYSPPTDHTHRIVVGAGGVGPIDGPPAAQPVTFRLWAPPPPAMTIAAIANDSFLEQTGTSVGGTVTADSYGDSLPIRLVGRAASFPTLDPGAPFAVMDATTVQLMTYASAGRLTEPAEWWLADRPGDAVAVEQTLAGPPFSARQVVGREALTRQLSADPIPLGLIGALGLGALAAIVIAAIGFVVAATVAMSERLGELALLRALGLSARAMSAWLALEHSFLLAFGLLAGSGLGLLLAWLVLPFATLTADGSPPVPAPAIVVPWEAVVPLYGLAAILLIVTTAVTTRGVPGIGLGRILRAQDG